VVLDLCGRHGVWFDHEELTRVLAWVRGGGTTEAEVPPEPVRRAPALDGGLGGGIGGGLSGGSPWGRSDDLGALLVGVAAALGRALFERR
jgi:hypothetical protein